MIPSHAVFPAVVPITIAIAIVVDIGIGIGIDINTNILMANPYTHACAYKHDRTMMVS